MDNKIIFTKTAKGLREATGKTRALSRRLRLVLKEVDGKSSVEEMLGRFDQVQEAELWNELNTLAEENYIREFVQTERIVELDFSGLLPPSAEVEAMPGNKGLSDALRNTKETSAEAAVKAKFVAQAKRKADEQTRQVAEAQARREAEERAKQEAAAKAKRETEAREREKVEVQARREAEANLLREIEEHAKRDAEAKAKPAADGKAKLGEQDQGRKVAEAKVRREAEEQAKRDTEARAQREAEEKVRREAEERSRREVEEKAQREAAKIARRKAEELARREMEDKTRREAEEKAKREVEEVARREAEERIKREAEEKARQEADDARRKVEEQEKREAEIRARREAEERARREAEEKAKRDTEERARREADEQVRHAAEERLRREAEEKAQSEAEELARREAEEKVKQEAEEKTRQEAEAVARREAEEQARREAEEEARRKAEERAKREAEEDARREADEKARREAEERGRQEAEERSRREAEEIARRDAEELARREAEEQARREAKHEAEESARRASEERARREAEDNARHEADERAKTEAAEAARREAEEKAVRKAEALAKKKALALVKRKAKALARQQAEEKVSNNTAGKAAANSERAVDAKKINLGKVIVLGLFTLITLGLGLVHVVSFDDQRAKLEKAASDQFQQPVNIETMHLALFPQPNWIIEGVSIGSERQIKVDKIKAVIELGSVFSEKQVFKSAEFYAPILNDAALRWLMFGKARSDAFRVERISAISAKLNSKSISPLTFDLKAEVGDDGNWQKIIIFTSDNNGVIELQPKGNRVQVEINADRFAVPFGSALTLGSFNAIGTAGRNDLNVTEFKGRLYGGFVSGTARLKWATNWSLDGDLSARQIAALKAVPGLLESGEIGGTGIYSMRGADAANLFAAPHVEGSFVVHEGVLLGVNLANLLKNGGSGGKTSFSELVGSFVHNSNRTQLKQMRLTAGIVSASGSAEADANANIRGRFGADLKYSTGQAHANVAVSGSLKQPSFSR